MADNDNTPSNLRSAVITEPNLMPSPPINLGGVGSSTPIEAVLRTPYAGNVRALPPPIPQLPMQQATQYGPANYGMSGGYGGFGGYGGYGSGFGNGGFGNYGYGSYGGYSSGYNRFGTMNPGDPETRFIQIAEASSRPAFQSIESLVSAIGNIASMLDSTFFALTSSFRAILGVAANFGRLRSVFAQFWSTFAIFRGFNWIYRKLLYWLRISNLDPSSDAFKKAYAEAINSAQPGGAPRLPRKGQSPWPVLAFLSFIFTAPYMIMKLLGTVTNSAQEEARNPAKWISPINTTVLYDFQARNPSELTLHAGSSVQIAPREIQQTLGLLNTGWALASINGQDSGIIPINYVKSPQQLRQERQHETVKQPQPNIGNATNHADINLAPAAFPAAPQQPAAHDIAPDLVHTFGPPTTEVAALNEGFA